MIVRKKHFLWLINSSALVINVLSELNAGLMRVMDITPWLYLTLDSNCIILLDTNIDRILSGKFFSNLLLA